MKANKLYICSLAIILFWSTITCHETLAQKNRNKKNIDKELALEDEETWSETPICKLTIVDSIVVNKNSITENIPMPEHLGKIFIDQETGNYTYENEFSDMRYITAKDTSGHHNIYRQILLANKWGKPELVKINGDTYDYINPYIMPDGQTLYFAARSTDDNEGRTYSLYTTTYDSETNTYLEPHRLPYPFYSDENDILYIEDDLNSIAWLVTTRRQEEGNACIYTISVKQPWEFYDNETIDPQKLKSLALIERISDTWTSEEQRGEVLNKIDLFKNSKKETEIAAKNINFVINNNTTYHSFSDFKKNESKNLYIELLDKESKHVAYTNQLKVYRKNYHNSSDENRQRLADVIIETENNMKKNLESIYLLKKEIRSIEQ